MQVSDIPQNNVKLYEEFSELKEYQPTRKEEIKFCFAGYPDAETVPEMLREEGEEITDEGCVVSGERSIDGEAHKISCMDDYIKWRSWNWLDK